MIVYFKKWRKQTNRFYSHVDSSDANEMNSLHCNVVRPNTSVALILLIFIHIAAMLHVVYLVLSRSFKRLWGVIVPLHCSEWLLRIVLFTKNRPHRNGSMAMCSPIQDSENVCFFTFFLCVFFFLFVVSIACRAVDVALCYHVAIAHPILYTYYSAVREYNAEKWLFMYQGAHAFIVTTGIS